MKFFLSSLILAFSISSLAADPTTQPPNRQKNKIVEDIQGSIVKPTAEQTAAVSKAAVRAKKLKKKSKKNE